MEVPENYRGRFSETGWRVLAHAVNASRRSQKNYVSLDHLVGALAAVEADLFDALLLDLAVDAREVRALVSKRMRAGLQHTGAGVRVAPEVNAYLKRAWRRARANARASIEGTDLLVALAEDKRGLFVEMLRGFGADADRVAFAAHRRAADADVRRGGELNAIFRLVTKPKREGEEVEFAAGDMVRVKSGPFASFVGKVEEVLKEASKLKVAVNIFGRTAAVELGFPDVEKLSFGT